MLSRAWGRLWIGGALLAVLVCGPTWADDPLKTAPEAVTVQVLKASLSQTQSMNLTLVEALRMAMEQNPAVQAAEDGVDKARAAYHKKLAEFLPDINVTYTDTDYEGAVQVFGDQVFLVDRNTKQPQILFRFPVFQGGKRFFQARATRKLLAREEATQRQTTQETMYQTAMRYYDLQRRLADIRVTEQQRETARESLAINQARLQAGTGTRLDVLQAEAQLARAEQQVLESVRLSQQAALRLNEILSLPAFVAVTPEAGEPHLQTLVPLNTDLQKLLAQATRHRADLTVIEKQIESLKTARQVVWGAVLPQVSLQLRSGGVGSRLGSIKHYDEVTYGVDLQFKHLVLPDVFQYRETTALLHQWEHQLQEAKNRVQREVSEALIQAISKQAQLTAVRAEVAATTQAVAVATERLKVGVGRNLDLMDAQTSRVRAQTTLNNTILEYNQAQVALVHAMGLASPETLTQGTTLP